ncbi:MAG: YvcK family protein, partial [Caldilineae bacterium]
QERRRRRTGPKIVVIGGGTGMPALLRGLRAYTENITAVVTVADDGGSSGRLRRQMGLLPPGDFRNNIAALSDAEDLMRRLLQYRFGDEDGLGNHSFGNLFIATMAAITGSFETGIAESSRVLAVRGRILPSTLDHVVLCAEVRRQRTAAGINGAGPDQKTEPEEEWLFVRGESRIPEAGGQIVRVHLEPANCRAYPETIRAILEADLILAAPGSFFTSLMPNLLVPNICKAIQAAKAPRIYICNVATQRGETDGFTVSDHMRQLRAHAGDAFTTVLASNSYLHRPPPAPDVDWVRLPEPGEAIDYRLFTGDLTDDRRPARHDPQKVAARVMEIYEVLKQESEPEPLP